MQRINEWNAGAKSSRGVTWRMVGTCICLSLVGALIPQRQCDAQNGTWLMTTNGSDVFNAPPLESMPLTVHPEAMTLGTQTAKAGEYRVGVNSRSLAYVPERCVGTQRCPLVVVLHDDAQTIKDVITLWTPVSDKYGMILLAPGHGMWERDNEAVARNAVDTAMQWVLTRFAVDPKQIALVAHWSSGRAAMGLGGYRLDLFSRVVLATSDYQETNIDPRNHTTRFLLTEVLTNTRNILTRMQALSRDGHPVEAFVSFRREVAHAEDHEWDVIARWLQQSWTTPGHASLPTVVVQPVPLLTTAMVTKMADFWTRFANEPDSTLRWAYQHEVALPIPGEHLSILMTDMTALAAHDPAVAADLKAAGLTAQEHDACRIALASANAVRESLQRPVTHRDSLFMGETPHLSIPPASILAKNVEFVKQHMDLIGATQSKRMSDMWHTP